MALQLQRPVALYGFTPGRIDVFWCATDQSSIVQTWSNDGTTWQAAIIAQSNGPFGLAPAIYSDQPGKMDIGWTDAESLIWYMRWTGSGWTTPVQLNPEAMTASEVWKPQNFSAGSPLCACATPLNRRSANTEFLICSSSDLRTWSLSTDGSTWFVTGGQERSLPFPPMQVKMATTPGGTPVLCQLAYDSQDARLRVSSGNIPFEFDESRDFPQGVAAAEVTLTSFENPLMPGWASLPGVLSYIGTLNNALGTPGFRPLLPNLTVRPETSEFAQLHPASGSRGAHDDERRLDRLMFEDMSNGTIIETPLKYSASFGPLAFAPALLARNLPSGDCVDLVYFDVHDLWHVRWLNGNQAIQSLSHDAGVLWEFGALLPIGGSGGLHVLWNRRSDGAIVDTFEGANGGWTTSTVANVPGASSPGGAVDAQGGVHAFWIGTDGRLYTASGTGGTWQAPTALPTPAGSFPVGNTIYLIKGAPPSEIPGATALTSNLDGTAVALSGNDATWQFEQTSPNVYHIKCTWNIPRGPFLSCHFDGSGIVDLFNTDDNSGRQKWQVTRFPDSTFTIAVSGGVGGGRNLYAYDSLGVKLAPTDDPNSPQQRWRIEPKS